MKYFKIIFIVYCAVLLVSCDYSFRNHDDIQLFNNYDSVIYVQFNKENNPLYYNEFLINKFCIKIEPKHVTKLHTGKPLGWEEFIASLPTKTVTFFISDTMLYKCNLSNVETHILQRYNLTIKDLEKLGWKLYYPSYE